MRDLIVHAGCFAIGFFSGLGVCLFDARRWRQRAEDTFSLWAAENRLRENLENELRNIEGGGRS